MNNKNGNGCWDAWCFDYLGSTVSTCKAVRNAQVRQSEIKTGKTISQDYTGSSGTVRDQRTAGHFVLKCTKFACRHRKG